MNASGVFGSRKLDMKWVSTIPITLLAVAVPLPALGAFANFDCTVGGKRSRASKIAIPLVERAPAARGNSRPSSFSNRWDCNCNLGRRGQGPQPGTLVTPLIQRAPAAQGNANALAPPDGPDFALSQLPDIELKDKCEADDKRNQEESEDCERGGALPGLLAAGGGGLLSLASIGGASTGGGNGPPTATISSGRVDRPAPQPIPFHGSPATGLGVLGLYLGARAIRKRQRQ